MNIFVRSIYSPFRNNLIKKTALSFYFNQNNKQSFQTQIGLKNKATLMGKIKRFERRKPKIARVIKFYLAFFFLGMISLSLIPGKSKLTKGVHCHFRRVQNWAYFIGNKSWFNYYWNFEIGKQKEIYIYYELQNLLMQMSDHQIYDINEIIRVFGEVQRIFNEDFNRIKINLQNEIARLSQPQDTYLEIGKDKQKLNSFKITPQLSQKKQKLEIKQMQQMESTSQNRRNQLKLKLKAQLDKKYQEKKAQQKITKKENLNIQDTNNSKEQKVQKSEKNNRIPQQVKNQVNAKSNLKITNSSEINVHHGQIDIRNIFWNSLVFSPSFNANMLMYYILILQNIIRSETHLIKNPQFYQIYEKAAQNFIFNEKIQKVLQLNTFQNKQSFKQINPKLERQVHFLKLLRKSSIKETINNGDFKNNNFEVVDPHKLLTYLINYRHLTTKQKNFQNYKKNSPQQVINAMKNETSKYQQYKIKSLIVNYLKLIDPQQTYHKQKYQSASKNVEKFEDSQSLIQMGIKNKGFIKSLQDLYFESKQEQKKHNTTGKNLKQAKKNIKQKQTIKKDKKQLQAYPTYQIIDSIFELYDKWYSLQNNKKQNQTLIK